MLWDWLCLLLVGAVVVVGVVLVGRLICGTGRWEMVMFAVLVVVEFVIEIVKKLVNFVMVSAIVTTVVSERRYARH